MWRSSYEEEEQDDDELTVGNVEVGIETSRRSPASP
jgi:hypothetical protein